MPPIKCQLADYRTNRPRLFGIINTPSATQPKPPIVALAAAGYGAVLGSIFPMMAVMTAADISGGLSVASDSGALVNTMQNIGAVAGILIAPKFCRWNRTRSHHDADRNGVRTLLACLCAGPFLGVDAGCRFAHGVFGGILPLMLMLLVMTSLRPGRGRFEGI